VPKRPQFLIIAILLSFLATPVAQAASAEEINIKVAAALQRFEKEVDGATSFLKAAYGVLVFPSVVKAGAIIGGEYGEGALLVGGQTVEYYSVAAGSIGFQLGAQTKTEIIMFMQKKALDEFRASEGWQAGVDGSVALVRIGAAESINTTEMKDPIIGFIFNNKGLMYNLTLEGTKFTRIVR